MERLPIQFATPLGVFTQQFHASDKIHDLRDGRHLRRFIFSLDPACLYFIPCSILKKWWTINSKGKSHFGQHCHLY